MQDGPAEPKAPETSKITEIEKLVPLTDKEILDKKERRNDELMREAEQGDENFKKWAKSQKKAVFIIPTQNLVEQQANTIDRYT